MRILCGTSLVGTWREIRFGGADEAGARNGGRGGENYRPGNTSRSTEVRSVFKKNWDLHLSFVGIDRIWILLFSSIERGRDRGGNNNDIPRAIIIIDFDELRLSNIDSLDGKFEWKFFSTCLTALVFHLAFVGDKFDICELLQLLNGLSS